MYTDEELTKLEEEERELTDEAIAIMLLILANVRDNLEKELRDFYQKYGKDGVVTYSEARKWISQKDHQRRLTALLLMLSLEFNLALDNLRIEFEKMLKSVISKESEFFDVEVDEDDVLEAMWGADDSNWLSRLEDDVTLWVAYLISDWKRLILQRKPINEVIKKLDLRFNSINSVINKLGLTESTAIGSLARRKIFKALGITKYRFYAKADERTCETCGSMHGLVFPISAYEVGSTASPLHPHCRCWEVPIVD